MRKVEDIFWGVINLLSLFALFVVFPISVLLFVAYQITQKR